MAAGFIVSMLGVLLFFLGGLITFAGESLKGIKGDCRLPDEVPGDSLVLCGNLPQPVSYGIPDRVQETDEDGEPRIVAPVGQFEFTVEVLINPRCCPCNPDVR